MNVLLCGEWGLVKELGEKIENEEHHVDVLIEPSDEEALEECKGKDFAVVEGTSEGSVRLRRKLRKELPTIGPSEFTSQLREDKSFAEKILSTTDCTAAPVGKESDTLSIWKGGFKLLKCEKENIERVEEYLSDHQVQTIPEGIPIWLGGWFDGHSFAFPPLNCYWYSRMATGGLGGFTYPPMGIAAWPSTHRGRAFKGTVSKVERMLRKDDFRGLFMMEAYLKNKEMKVTNVSTSLINLVPLLKEGLARGITKTLSQVARGDCSKWFCKTSKYIAANISTLVKGVPIMDIVEGNRKHLVLTGMEDKRAVDEVVGYCTAWGKDFTEARRRVYRTLKTVNIPYGVWRTDIGRGIGNKIKKVEHLF